MRIVDADEIIKETWGVVIKDMFHMDETVEVISRKDIDNAPTVKAIPIDKPFLKMRYGDYVVYNKKWLVNHLQTEWNILQGKEYKPAIPVEWFKSKIDAILDSYPDGNEETEILCKLLYEWEKENDN